MTTQNKSTIDAVFRRARIEELKLFVSFIKTHDETSTLTFDDVINYVRQNPYYNHKEMLDMNAIQCDVMGIVRKYKCLITTDVIKEFEKIQEKARKQWIKDFLNATTLDIYRDFEYNARKQGFASVTSTLRIDNENISKAFRHTFTWVATKQGHDVWSVINACYLRCVPISVTNKIYTMLTR